MKSPVDPVIVGASPPSPSAAASESATRDLDLLARIRGNEEGAFEELFRAHYAPLVRFAEGFLHTRELAEDTVQEVLLNLWRQRETLRVDDSVRGYLYRSVRNRALNQLRNERVRREAIPYLVNDAPEPSGGDTGLLETEIEAAVRAAVGALPPRCREVFELSRVHGMRYAEIAETLGISVKTVETQMGRALKTLRERLSKYLP